MSKEVDKKKGKRMKASETKKHDGSYYVVVSILALLFVVYIIISVVTNRTSYASSTGVEPQVMEPVKLGYQANMLEIPDPVALVEQKNQVVHKEELIVEEMDLEYLTEYQNNPDIPQGTIQTVQNGQVGKQEIVTKKVYENDELIEEVQIGNKVTQSAINKIVMIGTGPYYKVAEAKVGDTVYVTSTMLPIYLEPNEQSQKVITVYKNAEMKVVKKSKEWYYVAYTHYSGWAMKECLTTIAPGTPINEQDEAPSGTSKSISKNIKLNQKSGLTLTEFKKVLSNNAQDKDKVIQNNAEYFYYAEKQYNVNGIFIASVAVHESNWGTSAIAKKKKNLFGYGAYDRDPSGSAYTFSNYSESIDLLGRVFAKYYVNPPGTAIYDNQKASGKYYNGATLEGVNKRYATDKNWNNGVFKWMQYFYNHI